MGLKGLASTLKPRLSRATLSAPFFSDIVLTMILLNEKQKRHLRTLGHKLKPVVMIGGAGLTDAVQNEIELALRRHELLKIRVSGAERDEREAMIQHICDTNTAHLVQRIGHIALVYRRNEDKPRIQLP